MLDVTVSFSITFSNTFCYIRDCSCKTYLSINKYLLPAVHLFLSPLLCMSSDASLLQPVCSDASSIWTKHALVHVLCSIRRTTSTLYLGGPTVQCALFYGHWTKNHHCPLPLLMCVLSLVAVHLTSCSCIFCTITEGLYLLHGRCMYIRR